MTHETLAIIWFGLWGLIWAVYFVLDGYTLGTGMLFPFVAKKEQEERQLQETIGPFWGGNEVWLITAGGATFAAFPETYALMFSYLYTPLFLILFALFFRAIGLEFMHKHSSPRWKSFWKKAFFTGSSLIPFLFGVAFANLFRGLNIDENGYHDTLFSLLNGYAILGGLLLVALFLLSGSLWITLKTSGAVSNKAHQAAGVLWYPAVSLLGLFFTATANKTGMFENYTNQPLLWLIPTVSLVALVLSKLWIRRDRDGVAFTMVSLSIFTLMATGFTGLFPNMILSRVNPEYSLTLFEAAGSELNLKIMFFVALFIVPIVIAYQSWMYRIFREEISPDNARGYQ
ncbi:MAG: cytochrome d ubiquinol oxidase subunit II [Bacillaceae bacterium]|nr:cytochrome d ubiquinol oxidase subunit II [Bacillaceae bacterium]